MFFWIEKDVRKNTESPAEGLVETKRIMDTVDHRPPGRGV